MKHLIPATLFGVTLFVTGCQTSHIAVGPTRPPVSPEDVELFFSTPQFPFENVAIINTDSSFSLTFGEQSKVNKVIERLKREAAKLGANGIILHGLGAKYMFNVQCTIG